MTRDEAIKSLQNIVEYWTYKPTEVEAAKMAIAALRHQIWEEQVWHDAKTDPPKTPGLYYGKKDDTNSMYACRYRDSVWVLDMYPQQQMDIVQWADYAAFVRQDEDTALRPVSREQVEKFKEYFDDLYGKGLEVYGWHMNGEAKSFDDFYEGACEYAGL